MIEVWVKMEGGVVRCMESMKKAREGERKDVHS